MEPSQNSSENTRATYREDTKPRTTENNHVEFYTHNSESIYVKNIKHYKWEIDLQVPQIVNTEQLQHYIYIHKYHKL
jgi:hypothetical protein